jgi:hypothetical protein
MNKTGLVKILTEYRGYINHRFNTLNNKDENILSRQDLATRHDARGRLIIIDLVLDIISGDKKAEEITWKQK